jgi:organic radical activating enzyme
VETNGTITPVAEMYELVDQFNCSPKLSNSGDRRESRVHNQALTSLTQNPKVFFKFVVSGESDIAEILEYTNAFSMSRVYLMPLGKTREELDKTRQLTEQLCKEYGFLFSDRLHILKFGNQRAF